MDKRPSTNEEIDARLAAMLGSLEGPPHPLRRSRRPRLRRRVVLAAVVLPIAGAGGGVAAALVGGKSEVREAIVSSCVFPLRFDGRLYFNTGSWAGDVSARRLPRLRPIGHGTIVGCVDRIEKNAAGEIISKELIPSRTVLVDKVNNVRPALAVAVSRSLYILNGRCIGIGSLNCFRRHLLFDGRTYAPTRDPRSYAHEVGPVIGSGILTKGRANELVAVRSLKGISTERAVSVSVGRREWKEWTFIADDACTTQENFNLRACLRR